MAIYFQVIYNYYYGLGGIGYWIILIPLLIIAIIFAFKRKKKYRIVATIQQIALLVSILTLSLTMLFRRFVQSEDLIRYVNNCCPIVLRGGETIPPFTYYYEYVFLLGMITVIVFTENFVGVLLKKPLHESLGSLFERLFVWISVRLKEKRADLEIVIKSWLVLLSRSIFSIRNHLRNYIKSKNYKEKMISLFFSFR